MGMYEGWFPQTDAHEINLDWILSQFKTNMDLVTKINKAYESGELTGRNFSILGFFPTLEALQAGITSPAAGDAYGIGTTAPYDVYMYIDNDWSNLGDLSGEQGAPGADGKAATISVGSTTTLPSDMPAYVQNTGTQNAAVLSFGIPRGIDGIPGAKGDAGEGVPTGGTAGQVLAKTDDADYNTAWSDIVTIAKQSIIDAIYPVGSIYINVTSASPATLFGGTWESITNRYLVASGSDYALGSTGGASEVQIKAANLPSFNISIPSSRYSTLNSGTMTTVSTLGRYSSDPSGTDMNITVPFNGTNTPIDNDPPYLAVSIWKRTA
jgi:hypothetical protein